MRNSSRPTSIAPLHKRWQGAGLKVVGVKITAAFVLLTFLTMLFHGNWPLALMLVSSGIGFWWLNDVWQRRCERLEVLADMQDMSASKFTQYAAELLRAQGYAVLNRNAASGSQEDLVLTRGKEYIACWLHYGSRPARTETVAKAVAGVQARAGWRAMVLSSRRFTVSAWYRARREGCMLITPDTLANMITQYRRGHRVIAFPREEAADLRDRK